VGLARSRAAANRSNHGKRRSVEAVVLTHGHFDHLGFAERARCEVGVPVYVPDGDVELTRRPLVL
jgi:glyoxylase-like metal-dependent hydrolase (beta-lactamase superfamily II)